jgi:hypothetical protein
MSETCGTHGETDKCIYFGCKTEKGDCLGTEEKIISKRILKKYDVEV